MGGTRLCRYFFLTNIRNVCQENFVKTNSCLWSAPREYCTSVLRGGRWEGIRRVAANIKNSLLWKEKHEHRQQQIVKADGGSGDDDLKENGGQRKERRLKSSDTAFWKLLSTYIPDMVSKPRGVSTFPLPSSLYPDDCVHVQPAIQPAIHPPTHAKHDNIPQALSREHTRLQQSHNRTKHLVLLL